MPAPVEAQEDVADLQTFVCRLPGASGSNVDDNVGAAVVVAIDFVQTLTTTEFQFADHYGQRAREGGGLSRVTTPAWPSMGEGPPSRTVRTLRR